MRDINPSKKLPLIVLHQGRVNGGPAKHPINKKLLESWKKAGILYATPQGSNDDWYLHFTTEYYLFLYTVAFCVCVCTSNGRCMCVCMLV